MVRKWEIVSIPRETIDLAEWIKNNAHLQHRTDAFRLMNGSNPFVIDKIETKKNRGKKGKKITLFGRMEMEL